MVHLVQMYVLVLDCNMPQYLCEKACQSGSLPPPPPVCHPCFLFFLSVFFSFSISSHHKIHNTRFRIQNHNTRFIALTNHNSQNQRSEDSHLSIRICLADKINKQELTCTQHNARTRTNNTLMTDTYRPPPRLGSCVVGP